MRLPRFLRPRAPESAPPGEKGAPERSSSEPATIPPPGGRLSDAEFRTLYDAHFESVWHTLRRFSVAERDLLDATQNVFLVVHRKLPEFEGRSQLRTWIFQICRRVASDYRRSAAVRREITLDAHELTHRVDGHHDARSDGERAGLVQIARNILDKLPPEQREVFLLYELEQFSGEEIARELGVPLGTVRSRLRLARQAFRREVDALRAAEPAMSPELLAEEPPERDAPSETDPFALRADAAGAPPFPEARATSTAERGDPGSNESRSNESRFNDSRRRGAGS